jgi:hypothetical protein
MKMAEVKAKHNVLWSGNEQPAGGVKKGYDPLLEGMAVDFDIDINVVICHGKREFMPPEMDFEKFYIFCMMTPEHIQPKKTRIKKLVMDGKEWEVTSGQGDYLSPEGELPSNVSAISDERGKPIALIYDAALYFLSDFLHCQNGEEMARSLATFKYVIDKATATPELFRALKAGAEEKGKRALEHALSKAFRERLKKEETQLESSERLYNEYTQNAVKAQRKFMATAAILDAIKNNMQAIPDAVNKRWDATKKLEGTRMYDSISFQQNSVKGITTPIYIEYNSIVYKLGKFEVTLGFQGSIRIHSLWPERGVSQDHPHVSSGNPCWGNLSGEVPKRIAESEFDVAFVDIYIFLTSYDSQNPYSSIDHWPQASQEEVEAWKKSKNKEE